MKLLFNVPLRGVRSWKNVEALKLAEVPATKESVTTDHGPHTKLIMKMFGLELVF